MSELIVETMEHCFLCLDQVPHLSPVKLEIAEIGHGHGSDSPDYPLHHSLRYLSRYLEMDMRKVFLNEGPTTTTRPRLVDKVMNSNLKVKLCENCVWLNTKFSKLYRQLEIIQMELSLCINLIHGKLTNAEQTSKAENFRQNALGHDEDDTDELKAKIKIADVLRIEAMTKCNEKLSAITPKVHVRKLTDKRMNMETPNLKTCSQTQVNLDPLAEEDIKVVKLENDPDSGEDSGSQEWIPQAGEDNDEVDQDDMGDDHPHAPTTPVSPKPTPIPEECSSIDPGTGRVTCSICFKPFKNNRNFRDHYKHVHVRVRHRCKACGKVFNQMASLIRHTRTIHKQIKPECPKCHRSFDWSSQLVEHLKRPSCESTQTSTCKCQICGRVFSNNYLYKHMKRCHFIGP